MQLATRVGAQTNDVARVGGDFRMNENEVEQSGARLNQKRILLEWGFACACNDQIIHAMRA